MGQRTPRLGLRLTLLTVLALIPAAGLVGLLAVTGRTSAEGMGYVALVGMLALAAAWVGGNLFIRRGLNVLVTATKRIAAGDLGARVDVKNSATELGQLGLLFNELAHSLQCHVQEAERQAEAVREQARLLDLAHDAILVRGLDGAITYWNRGAHELYGWSAAEALGRDVHDLLRVESSLPRADIEAALLRDGRWEGETVHSTREGIGVWVASRFTVEADAQGRPLRILELHSNIVDRKRAEAAVLASHAELEQRVAARTSELTLANQRLQAEVQERKRAEEELRKAIEATKAATQAKSAFLASMSHEIRTPLNGVIGMLGLLEGTPLTDQQAKYVRVGGASAQSLLDLISDILDFSKLEANRVELEAAPFNLHEVVELLVETFAPRASQKGLELVCHFQSELPQTVRGDAHRLRQVLNNLLSNAVKFTAEGQVTLRATLEREIGSHVLVRFAVKDTGIGISRERIEQLFQPFSQADSSTTRRFGGTGLGLAICKGLVELMGGQIEAESEAGAGSTFGFTLVLQKEAPETEQPHRPGALARWHDLPDAVRARRVLVAEQSASSRAALCEQLQSWGMRADCAEDGVAALTLLRQAAATGEPFGLVLLDRHLMDLDVMRFAVDARAAAPQSPPLLVIMTRIGDSVSAAEWRSRGFAACVSKPLLPSRVLDAVMEAVAPAQAARVQHRKPTAGAGKPQSLRVLLAEDNEVNEMVATEILLRAGIRCDVVRTGRRAVEAICSKGGARGYDVLLMDCQMPEMDGFEAARAIRQWEAEAKHGGEMRPGRLPIVALTANAIKGDRERCLAAGMDGYLTKPINPTELVETVLSFLPEAPAEAAAGEAAPVATVAAAGGDGAPHPVHVTSGATAPLDLPALMVRCLRNEKLVMKVLGKFETQLQVDVERLEQLLLNAGKDAGDDEAQRIVHGLKGASASMCAEPVRKAAAELEQRLRSGDHGGAVEALAVLREAARECGQALPGLRESLSGVVMAAA